MFFAKTLCKYPICYTMYTAPRSREPRRVYLV